MTSESKSLKKKKVRFDAPKIVPELRFRSLKELNESDLSVLFWSENRNEQNQYGTLQNEFIDYLTHGKIFHIFISGETLEGKGVTLENLTEYYHKNFKDFVIIDVSGKNYEGCFWAKNYKCYFVYPQLLKARKTTENENVIEKKLNKKNHWKKLIQLAKKNKRILVLMCRDPLEPSFLKAQAKLFHILNTDDKLTQIRKVLLLREISFVGYKHGTLKATTDKLALENKRLFLNLCRTGRHGQNQIIADAQRGNDIDDTLKDNVALRVFKRSSSGIGNYPNYVKDTIKTLQKHQAVFEFRGKIFTGIIKYNDWHKKETDKIENIGVFPEQIELENYTRYKENAYIERVSEVWTNSENRAVIGRRRHVQNTENTKLCTFEIADLLGLEYKIEIKSQEDFSIAIKNLIYGEIKFRAKDSKHPKIETGDVIKTIQDLALKKIIFDDDVGLYFWTLEKDITKQLNWKLSSDYYRIPTIVEMVTPTGATVGAQSLLDKHHINLKIIKIDKDLFE